jgi:hypothetical protein
MTGYAFLFSPERNLNRAAQLRSETRWQSPLTLAYDVLDSDAQLLAERVALNAREAGIPLEPASSARDPDLRLVRIPLQSSDARLALGGVATEAGLPVPKFDRNSWDEIYERERDLVQTYRIIPLLHVPDHVLIAPQVNGWQEDLLGSWHLERVWLESVHP